MTQTVIGVFNNLDTAYEAGETLIDQEGIDESCFHITANDGDEVSQEELRNFLGDLFGSDSTERIEHYAERINQGGALLLVDLPDDVAIGPFREAMTNVGATDLEIPFSPSEARSDGSNVAEAQGQTIPIVEEEMEIGKKTVGKGGVRVTSGIEEIPVQEDISLKEERATVTRRPVDRPASADELSVAGEKSYEVEETTEKPVISKRARVVEEVEIGKETSEKIQRVEDSVRRTNVNVEQTPPKARSTTARKPGK